MLICLSETTEPVGGSTTEESVMHGQCNLQRAVIFSVKNTANCSVTGTHLPSH